MRIDVSFTRWLLFPWGARALERLFADGFPARFRPALRFLLTRRLPADHRAVVRTVEALRAGLASREAVEVLTAFPRPGPNPAGTPGAARRRSWARIADTLSVDWYWGAFLYLAATASGARTILELGGCAGISGGYLASAGECRRFLTVEGSPELASVAEANLRRLAPAAATEVVRADFESALDRLLPALGEPLDLVFLDGQHDRRSTLHYHARLLPHLQRDCLVLFDDIHYTAEMDAAWEELSRGPGVRYAIDLGRMGLCLRGDGPDEARRYDLSSYTHRWGRGRSRSA